MGTIRKIAIGIGFALTGVLSLADSVRRLDHKRSGNGHKDLPSLSDTQAVDGIFSQDGTRLHVDCQGDVAPTVFFVHGVTCNCNIWRYQKAYFSGKYRIISLDLRGHGRSAVPESMDMHPQRLGEDLRAAVEYFQPEEFVVVAHSMGGMAAIKFHEHFGQEYRGRLKGFALMDTAGIDLIKGMAMGRLIDFLYPIPIAGLLTLLAKENFLSRAFMRLFKDSALAYFMARGIFGENPQACEVEFQREMTISTPIPSIAMGLKACLDYHAEDHLPRVDIPVLVMVGTRDIFTKRRAVTETCELLPDARCQVYKGAGHNPLLERPEQVNKDLEVFLEECFEKSQLKKAV